MNDLQPLSPDQQPPETTCPKCLEPFDPNPSGKCRNCQRKNIARWKEKPGNIKKMYESQKKYRERKKRRILTRQTQRRQLTQDLFMNEAVSFFKRFNKCWEKRGTSGYFLPADQLPELQELRQIANKLKNYSKQSLNRDELRKRLESFL